MYFRNRSAFSIIRFTESVKRYHYVTFEEHVQAKSMHPFYAIHISSHSFRGSIFHRHKRNGRERHQLRANAFPHDSALGQVYAVFPRWVRNCDRAPKGTTSQCLTDNQTSTTQIQFVQGGISPMTSPVQLIVQRSECQGNYDTYNYV